MPSRRWLGGAVAVAAEQKIDGLSAAFVQVKNARRTLALAAAKFYARQPNTIAAVTGTSGKTSVAAFTRQIWAALGRQAASIGTVGVVSPKGETYGSLTTPDPVELHRTLDQLAGEGVTHLALEASSHGLDQHRLDGVRIAAGAFTNLSRDHMDYHPTIEDYLAAKMRLFSDLVVDGGTAVIDVDDCYAGQVVETAKKRGLKIMTVGEKGDSIKLVGGAIEGFAQVVTLAHGGKTYKVKLPLVGGFQVQNAAVSAGLAIATGSDPARVFASLEKLAGAKGRLELAGTHNGAPIFIDYAHKPDALAKALQALRPYASGKLIVVFGAGGDREYRQTPDHGAHCCRERRQRHRHRRQSAQRKSSRDPRRHSGRVAGRHRDRRPRRSDPRRYRRAQIRRRAADRRQRPRDGPDRRRQGSAVFRPRSRRRGAAWSSRMSALWTIDDMAKAMRATKSGALPVDVTGISIDSRTAAKGDAFFAIQGDNRDGHEFVAAALKGGASLAVVARRRTVTFAADAPLLEVDDVLEALRDLARAARARFDGGQGDRGHWLGRQDRYQGSVASRARCRWRNLCLGCVLQQSLGRAALALKMSGACEIRRSLEIGMNHAGEITPLTAMVRPHVAIITTVEPVHLEYFGSLEKIADAKAEIFTGIEPGGTAVLNRDNSQYARLAAAAKAAKVSRIVTFGESDKADSRTARFSLQPDSSTVEADILGEHVTYKLGAPGKHLVLNSLAVLTAVSLADADLALAALALDRLKPATGRGARMTLKLPSGSALLIDESYEATPTRPRCVPPLRCSATHQSVSAAAASPCSATCWNWARRATTCTAPLTAPLEAAHIDLVYCFRGRR